MAKIVKIDFDGTIVQHRFPKIGDEMPGAFEVMKKLKEAGFKLILWTCREDDSRNGKLYLKDAVDYCRENGIEFDAINETLLEEEFRPDSMRCRKPYAHYHIDDRNLGGFPGWDVVKKVLIEKKELAWEVID